MLKKILYFRESAGDFCDYLSKELQSEIVHQNSADDLVELVASQEFDTIVIDPFKESDNLPRLVILATLQLAKVEGAKVLAFSIASQDYLYNEFGLIKGTHYDNYLRHPATVKKIVSSIRALL